MKKTIRLLLTCACLIISTHTFAKGAQFNLLKATPIGSWQVREDIQSNHKGKQTGSTIKTSLLSSEIRDGEKYYWVETVIDSFKISKKGKRKAQGDQTVMKSLIAAATISGDPANVMGNLRGLGVETIMQTGNNDPMRINNSGGLIAGVMKAAQIEINYQFNDLGSDNTTVPAGDFNTQKMQGTGHTEVKVLFKKMRIDSNTTVWLSSKVPFGTVKISGTSTINGKPNTFTSELLEYGTSGAETLIIKEPKDMPAMPNFKGMFK